MKEAHNLEFKREWKDDLLKWISAFANARGGALVLGVDDDQAVGLASARVTDQVTDQVTVEVSRLLAVMQGEMTRAELQTSLGLKHLPHFLNAGFIEMTIPEKPNSRLQRYRLTELGKSLVDNFR